MTSPRELTATLQILIVEDDSEDYLITKRLLRKAIGSYELTWVPSSDEALSVLQTQTFDAGLIDYRLGPDDGLDLIRAIKQAGHAVPLILFTGQGDFDVGLEAIEAGASDYLVKGEVDASLLERAIRYAISRSEAEQQIRAQAELLDKARDAICVFSLDREVAYWNKSAERLTGWTAEEVLGTHVEEHLVGPSASVVEDVWRKVLDTGEWTGEMTQPTKDGDTLTVESRWTLVRNAQGEPERVLVINTDITERKQLESQFLRAQRMESIGRLVSGIAHDLGNLLVPITLGVEVLQARFKDERTRRSLAMIRKSAERGSDMVKQVLAFARGVEGERVSVQPAEVIHEVERIVTETFRSADLEVDVQVPDDLWNVTGDATQMQQVLMNLCVNARDAMPEGGRLLISAENMDVDEAHVRMNLGAKTGRFVRIVVTDTGEGIPPDTLHKIFEPFFTTKEVGKGTGLGLSTVYSIVQSHGGFVSAYSEVGRGTSIKVYFKADADLAADETATDDRDVRGRGERVLVVDDEAFILDTAAEVLETAGYEVIAAAHGEEALSRIEREPLDAIVTDLVMPGIDGIELIRTIRAQGRDVPIVATSGMAGEKARDALDAGADAFVAKPYTADQLRSAVRDVLQAQRKPA